MPRELIMTLSAFERRRIEQIVARHCEDLEAPELRTARRQGYRFEGNQVTLIEHTASEDNPDHWIEREAVQFRFDSRGRTWGAYVLNECGSWVPYELIDHAEDLEDLLEQAQGAPTAIVWG